MNKNIWNLYKNSERGKNAIDAFLLQKSIIIEIDDLEKIQNEIEKKLKSIFQYCHKYIGYLSEENYFINDFYCTLENTYVDDLLIKEDESVSIFFDRLIDNFELGWISVDENGKLFKLKDKKPFVKQKDYKAICTFIPNISLVLYYRNPEIFTPILFYERFNVFMKILDALEIPIPPLPAKTDKRGRLLFYNDLNSEILRFAKENNLTPEETCACIYDFALMLIEEDKNTETDLPEPTNIWFTGGSKEDYETFLKEPKQGAKSVWTCNENTKRGDIIVMYVRTPYSFIQSIWRADIDGIYTPFNYHNGRTEVTNGIVFPPITLNEIKNDSYFFQLPIVRKNLQGINGVQFSATDYKELQRLLTAKGFDISVLPQLYNPDLQIIETLKNEKDVEEKLLIPILEKLGYSETDWTRQLSQKAGRNEKAIPDFVFFPKGEIHFQNAPMIIEAKYDMSSNIERTKTYNQALSYARIMKSSIFGICDKDRLIIYKEKNGGFDRFKPILEKHWQSLNEPEAFSKLKNLIGKNTIKGM